LYWGREAARARRIVAETDLQYRVWKERMFLEAKATPVVVGAEDNGALKTKLPTDAQAQAVYRLKPEYSEWHRRKILAQEAAENAETVYESLRTKKELIKAEVDLLRDEAGGSYVVIEDDPRLIPRIPQGPESDE
jgi:hypothetical protein